MQVRELTVQRQIGRARQQHVGKFRDQGVKFFYTSLNGWIMSGGDEFLKALG